MNQNMQKKMDYQAWGINEPRGLLTPEQLAPAAAKYKDPTESQVH